MMGILKGLVVNSPAASCVGFDIIVGDAAYLQILTDIVLGRENETFHVILAFKVMP